MYVIPGSDAEAYVAKRFPHKKARRVGGGRRPRSIRSFLSRLPHVFQRHASEGLDGDVPLHVHRGGVGRGDGRHPGQDDPGRGGARRHARPADPRRQPDLARVPGEGAEPGLGPDPQADPSSRGLPGCCWPSAGASLRRGPCPVGAGSGRCRTPRGGRVPATRDVGPPDRSPRGRSRHPGPVPHDPEERPPPRRRWPGGLLLTPGSVAAEPPGPLGVVKRSPTIGAKGPTPERPPERGGRESVPWSRFTSTSTPSITSTTARPPSRRPSSPPRRPRASPARSRGEPGRAGRPGVRKPVRRP